MYSCKAEHSHELSFPKGALFYNGKIRAHFIKTAEYGLQLASHSMQYDAHQRTAI